MIFFLSKAPLSEKHLYRIAITVSCHEPSRDSWRLTHWPLGPRWALVMKLLSRGECHRALLMIVNISLRFRQPSSHHLSQHWPRFLRPYGVARSYHNDVIEWKHFPRYSPFVQGIHRSPVNSPHKRPVTRSFDVSLICALNKRLSKQSWGWWFETPSRSFWRRCNVLLG